MQENQINNSFNVICSKCNAENKVTETPMNFPGSRETEEYYCQNCKEKLGSIRTSGIVNTILVKGS